MQQLDAISKVRERAEICPTLCCETMGLNEMPPCNDVCRSTATAQQPVRTEMMIRDEIETQVRTSHCD
jgi:hypothetical protein